MSVDAAAEEHFGPYLVYERLGVGGMATVHRALEQGDGGPPRTVALKRLLPHLAEDASFIKSFVREAKLASLLNHVNIVQIYELGRVGTEYFISMEYIDGRDVRRLLRHARKVTGPPPIYVTIGLMIQLCDALDYAHNQVDEDGVPMGLVHRDISPSNLIVTSQGHLKVIDFGIAKAQSSQLRTQTGRVKGKLAYMAPEAISGSRDLDARSDIWATGVILHEMITARPLFASKNEYQTLLKVQKGDLIPPSTFNQACPPELDAIVAKALARDADQRYANAAELREELVALKRQYALQTGYRDVSQWIEWAFGLESPGGFSGDTSGVVAVNTSAVHHKTPRPPRDQEEDEAVEVVWGSGANESEDGPVVLEEVPDVSEKHHRARRDTEDSHVGDMPTPLPRHGTLPSIYGEPEIEVVPQPTARKTATQSIPPVNKSAAAAMIPPIGNRPRSGAVPTVPPPNRTGGQPVVPRSKASTTGVQSVAIPPSKSTTGVQAVAIPPNEPRPHRSTSPGIAAQQRTSDRMPVPGAPRSSDRMPASAPIQLDAPQLDDRIAAARARESEAPPNVRHGRPYPRLDTTAATSESQAYLDPPTSPDDPDDMYPETVLRAPHRASLSEEELFGNDAAEVLRGVSAHIEAMSTRSTMPNFGPSDAEPVTSPEIKPVPLPNVPVVRFSKTHTIPPVNVSAKSPYQTGGLDEAMHRVPQTRPGVAPAAAITLPRTPHNQSQPPLTHRAPSHHSQPPLSNAATTLRPSAPYSAQHPAVIVPAKKKTWLFVLVGVLIAGGTATLVALSLGGDAPTDDAIAAKQGAPEPTPAITPPVKSTGTVKFVIQPDDAEIRIEGKVVHTGSPWSQELTAGIHQVEIHKPGYKSWLTSLELSANENHALHIVLDSITSAQVVEDATLTITTTPAGLDVVIDGAPFASKTPIKASLKVGSHKISVMQNGVEVWQQTVNAEAASDYEFNPSFTDDKKRERAQRVAPPRPAPKAPAPAADSGSGSAEAAPVPPTPAPETDGAPPPITTPL